MAPSEQKKLRIACYISTEISPDLWNSYKDAFNEAFNKSFTIDQFHRKYNSPGTGYAYHSVLYPEDEPGTIVGSCSVIPHEYRVFDHIKPLGLLVDVFILKEYRYDPLSLVSMYGMIKNRVMEDGIFFMMAVPNEMAYPVWKNIMKFREISNLHYYLFPVRAGNLLKKWRGLNAISLTLLKGILPLLEYFTKGNSFPGDEKPIHLIKSDEFLAYRFSAGYTLFKNPKGSLYYKIHNEEGIKTAYLVDFAPSRISLFLSGVRYIIRNEKADAIIFVGSVNSRVINLFRIPARLEPRKLPLMGIILKENVFPAAIYSGENWDFGLVNFDVR